MSGVRGDELGFLVGPLGALLGGVGVHGHEHAQPPSLLHLNLLKLEISDGPGDALSHEAQHLIGVGFSRDSPDNRTLFDILVPCYCKSCGRVQVKGE